MFVLKVKKLEPEARLPEYAHPGDAGLDIFALDEKVLNAGESALIRTGIQIELPSYTEAQVRPRSGLALKHQITLLNTPGTIDAGYRGEVGVIMINHGKHAFRVEKGMKIAQLVLQPVYHTTVVEVNELADSNRGEKGFGSTGI